MKRLLIILLAGCGVVIAPMGCVKSDIASTTNGLSTALKDLPNVNNFSLQATTAFAAGAEGLVRVFSSTLGNGTFDINFSLSGSNTGSSKSTLTMYGGTGTFSTPVLTSAGPTTVTVTSITNAGGNSATPSTANTSAMFDSTGFMGANYITAAKAYTQFVTNDVSATITGSLLSIQGVMWTPNLTTISIVDHSYSGATGVVTVSGTGGSVTYGEAGTVTVSEIASSGSYTITSTSPLITGSFSVTNPDNSTLTGTFSCPKP